MSGYSGTPLAKKLGIKGGLRIAVINPPRNYPELIGELPTGVLIVSEKEPGTDLIHLFAEQAKDLEKKLPSLIKQINADGAIWISWYKKAAGISTDITEDKIRAIALPMGWVDVKVCAVDDKWSGLKLVIRKKLRK